MNPERQHWLDDSANVDKVVRVLYIVCALLFLFDIFSYKHAHFGFENWFGFYAIFGFVAFAGIVLLGKRLRKVLMRGEDYYDE